MHQPQNLSIVSDNKKLPIYADLYQNGSSTLVIFISGDGRKGDFDEVATELSSTIKKYDYMTFFFRGVKEGNPASYKEFTVDFADLVQYLKSNYQYEYMLLVATSSGAVTATYVLQKPTIPIIKAVFLDPADYYLPNSISEEINTITWDGSADYNPKSGVVSDLMRTVSGKVNIDVVGFTLRNTVGGQYVPANKRHIDSEGCEPRLNQKMVKAFYDKTPDANKGEYLTINNVPHAFVRDGDVQTNIQKIVEMLSVLLMSFELSVVANE